MRLIDYSNLSIVFIGEISEHLVDILLGYNYSYEPSNLLELTTNDKKLNLLFIDTYRKNSIQIKALNSKYKTIFLDDFHEFDYAGSFGVINFTINAKSKLYLSKYQFLGVDYFPYKKELIELRKNNLIKSKPLTKYNLTILIFLSATKVENEIILSALETLDKFFFGCTFLLLGMECFLVSRNQNNFQMEKFTSNIEEVYKKVDLVISGGGLVKYESAFCSIPNFSLAVTKEQDDETTLFELNDLTYSIGNLYNFNIKHTIKRLHMIMDDKLLFEKFKRSSKINFDQCKLNDITSYL